MQGKESPEGLGCGVTAELTVCRKDADLPKASTETYRTAPYRTAMASSPLDQLVKGAPAPNTSVHQVAASAYANPNSNPPLHSHAHAHAHHDANDRLASLKTPRPPYPPSDPTSLLPSSPPQIYLNLLIMEASLRSQYLTLRARRRQNTFVLTLLALWILFFFYLLWLRPREDGKGIGGSQYWLVDMGQKVCFITGVMTALLFWATGQWERGVRWPRRWIGIANRGLRGMNAKIVVIRGPWWQELANWAAFVLPFSGGLWGGETAGSSYHFINLAQEKKNDLSDGRPRHRIIEDGKEYAEEDIAPGGDYIKLLLLPKPFTPDFRENWELYRTEYWERENERRAELRKRVRARQREIAREEGGVLWWTGWRGWKRARGLNPRGAAAGDVEKSALHPHHPQHSHSHSLSASNSLSQRKRRPSTLRGRDTSTHSRSSSRSTTPTPDLDDRLRPLAQRERRWSTSTTDSVATRSDSRRKKSTAGAVQAQSSRMAPPKRLTPSSGDVEDEYEAGGDSRRASLLIKEETLEDEGVGAEPRGRSQGEMGPPPVPVKAKGRGGAGRGSREGSRDREGKGNVFPNAPSA
ncbi:hypothetical protein BS50DRAFT_673588 [Corynespora cassiicola Philippines]|uniref:Spo7-domain-containing protein n=1 Tax=Corynespora cassiicola Philippines TaxID=1448308 RepID=A0A2T2NZL3_CORCC|nr:hypothetical protein BS50DRAFT_673588 [Corynespora cassiicola Philippines]